MQNQNSQKETISLLTSIIESPKDIVIFALNRNYEYLAFNENHRRTINKIWGVEIEVGMNMLEIIKIIKDRNKAKKNFDRVLAGERFTLIEKYGEPPNRLFYENTYNPVKNNKYEIVGLTVFLTDITQKVESAEALKKYHEQLEELLEQRTANLKRTNKKLLKKSFKNLNTQEQLFAPKSFEAIANFTLGVATQFQNHLTIILENIDFLAENLAKDKILLSKVLEIQTASQNANDLAKQLLEFSQKQNLFSDVLNLNLLVANVEKEFRNIIGKDIFVKAVYDFSIKAIRADQNLIEKIIFQLLVNAKNALPNGGEIKIKTQDVNITQKLVKEIPHSRLGEFVCLSIEDNGIGMSEEAKNRIFESFVPTKVKEGDSELELSVIYRIIRQCEGWMNVISSPNKGTKFNIYFPTVSGSTESVSKPIKSKYSDYQGNGELIFIVEDESEVREVASIILSDNGYKTIEASNAEEAIEVFLKNKGRIDLIFADIVLPDKNGLELWRQIKTFKPNSKILFTSGHTTENLKLNLSMENGSEFLFKPYNMLELLKKIKSALE